MAERREARLRPEFAQSYPGLTPGVWEAASVITEKVIAWRLMHRVAGMFLWDRVLNPDHFEFRGRPDSRPDPPSRSTDAAE
ncbi:MAG TPA: hypothetical protein VHR41_14675 [Gemmatimonadales bacterium]|jgi:hypothetical protein|nr:hypothetical protein [Gemmatimonadales bacterium]